MKDTLFNALIALAGILLFAPDADFIVRLFVGIASIVIVRISIWAFNQ